MSSSIAGAPVQERPARRRRVSWRRVLLLIVAIVVLTVAWLWWRWASRPAFYYDHQQFMQQTTPEERRVMAEDLTKHVSMSLSYSGRHPDELGDTSGSSEPEVNGDDPTANAPADNHDEPTLEPFGLRKLIIPTRRANAWLEQEMPGWLKQQYDRKIPGELSDLAFGIRDGRLLIGAQVDTDKLSQWITLVCRLDVASDGSKATVHIEKVFAGQLRMPAETVLRFLKEHGVGDASAISKVTQAFAGLEFEPVITFDHETRQARLLSYHLEPEVVTLVFRMEPGPRAAGGGGNF